MTIQHPKFQNIKPSVQSNNGVPMVHTVAPPTNDDLLFAQQMEAVMERIDNVEPIKIDDSIIQKAIDKKRVLEKLVLFKQPVTKTLMIQDMTFKIKLLNPDDNVSIFRELKKLTSDEQIVKTPVMLLAASIIDIDGIRLSDIYTGPEEVSEPLLRSYYEITKWPVALVNVLSAEFQSFTTETEKGFTKDFLKK